LNAKEPRTPRSEEREAGSGEEPQIWQITQIRSEATVILSVLAKDLR